MWLLVFISLALAQDPLSEPPLGEVLTQEKQKILVYNIAKDLRCPTCQGVSVADSGADGARAMKSRIQELVALGYTDDQIHDYFVSKYGEWILLRPQKDHRVLWFAPVVFLSIGGLIIMFRGTKKSEVEEQASEEVSAYRASILKELEED